MVMYMQTEVDPSSGDLLYKSSNKMIVGSGHVRKQISHDGSDLMGRLQNMSEAGQTTVYTGPNLDINVDNYIANVI